MSYNFCTNVSELNNVGVNCKLIEGYESLGWIISRQDLDFNGTKFNADNELLIDTLAVKQGAIFKYIGQLKEAFADTTVSLTQSTYRNTFNNTVSFKVFENSAEITKTINALANGEYVFVLEQKIKDSVDEQGDVTAHRTYRVFGWENGCVASAIDQDNYNEDLASGWSVSLEETNSSSAAYYLNADAVTDALFPKP